jgi:hypothetical protein
MKTTIKVLVPVKRHNKITKKETLYKTVTSHNTYQSIYNT